MYCGDWKALPDQSLAGSVVAEEDEITVSCLEKHGVVSFYAELPVSIKFAMTNFIEKHPNWDQYRLI